MRLRVNKTCVGQGSVKNGAAVNYTTVFLCLQVKFYFATLRIPVQRI